MEGIPKGVQGVSYREYTREEIAEIERNAAKIEDANLRLADMLLEAKRVNLALNERDWIKMANMLEKYRKTIEDAQTAILSIMD